MSYRALKAFTLFYSSHKNSRYVPCPSSRFTVFCIKRVRANVHPVTEKFIAGFNRPGSTGGMIISVAVDIPEISSIAFHRETLHNVTHV